ncbi:MAG TPA: hypothetical protein PLV92_26640, partial [Pirellulaceae bacterium]|nr:hypothetical protein [Pirellulaceae bacterium]
MDKRVGRLNFAVHDAIELAHLFVFELGLLPARNCHVLLSGKPSHPRVTAHLQSLAEAGAKVATADRSQVLLQLEQVCGVSQKSTDLLVCAVSSHGFTAGGSAYFLPADGVRTKLSQTGVSLNEFETEMERSKAGHRLLLVDACQERVQTKAVGVPEAWQITDKAFKAAFDRPTGQYKFASCSVQELSYESGELGNVGHGVFSHAVLEALRGGAPADDEHLIRLTAVEKYVSAYVTNWTRESRRPAQTPYRGGSIASGSLPLARKSSDLKTLANTVKAMPRTANFTAELQRGLLARLERADPASDRDRELVRLTRQYAQGAVPEVAFAAYLEKELAIRPSPESMAMRLSFLVRDGAGEQGPPLAGATVMVTGRA